MAFIGTRRLPGADLQKMVYGILTIKMPTIPVYDRVPPDTAMPYITLSSENAFDWSSKYNLGVRPTLDVHIWSKYSGFSEVKGLGNQVVNALATSTMTMADNWNVVSCELSRSNYLLDPDGYTEHGVLTFEFKLQDMSQVQVIS